MLFLSFIEPVGFVILTVCLPSVADIDECVSVPCQNGGTCVDQINGYLCQCEPGYTDLQCQTGEGHRCCLTN